MAQGKTISVSFRVSPRFKSLLEAAASPCRERLSLTDMFETLLFAYCDEHGIEVADETAPNASSKGEAEK